METSRLTAKPWWQVPVASAPRPRAPGATPGKGEYGGACHRIACENPDAHWFNEANGKYYCGVCAKTFNDVCRKHNQPPLCELRI